MLMTPCSETKLLLTVVRYHGQCIKGTMGSIAPGISYQAITGHHMHRVLTTALIKTTAFFGNYI